MQADQRALLAVALRSDRTVRLRALSRKLTSQTQGSLFSSGKIFHEKPSGFH